MILFYKEVNLKKQKDGMWRHPDGRLLTTKEVIRNYHTQEGAFCDRCMCFIDFVEDEDNYYSDDHGTFMCGECSSWYKIQTGF